MRLNLLSFSLLLTLSLAFLFSPLNGRTFTDKQGRQIQATLLGVENETISLKLDHNGIIYNIGISDLCDADREFVQKLIEKKNKVTFEKDVLPILQEKCFRCHSERSEKIKGGLKLNTKALILKGGETEGLIVPGDADASLLYELITLPEGHDDIMPPEGKGDPATEKQKTTIATWINEGAKFGDWRYVSQDDIAVYAMKETPGLKPLSSEEYGKSSVNPGLNFSPRPKTPMRLSQPDVRMFAERIDNLVNDYRKNRGVQAAPGIDDNTFVRRIYLDIVGRIPTQEERQAFLDADDFDKREKLVNHLLDTEGYTHNFFQFWANAFRVNMVDRAGKNLGEVYYTEWLKEVIRKNVPYNQIAFDAISAIGYPHQNGAVGYLTRDRQMPADHMANTVQLFLGMQLQCAQCHDHPFDRWNRKDFLAMEAFYKGTKWGEVGVQQFQNKGKQSKQKNSSMMMGGGTSEKSNYGVPRALFQERRNTDLKFRQAMLRLNYTHFSDSVWEPARFNKMKFPDDYQYKDGKPKGTVKPRVLMGKQPEITESPRRSFAEWVSAEDNPWFAKVLGNRLWKKTMGIGLIEPVDEITYATEGNMPGLMNELAYQLKVMKFNMKDFLRVLYSTDVYQMAVMSEDTPENYLDYHYTGRPLQRMSGAQIWDSLLTLAIKDPDDRKGYGQAAMNPEFRQYHEKVVQSRGMELFNNFEAYTAPSIKYMDPLRTHYKKTKTKPPLDPLAIAEGKRSYGGGSNMYGLQGVIDPRWEGVHYSLVRTSELRSPADEFHLTRQFGQSDRKTINQGRREGSITQALTLLNGPMHAYLSSKKSEIAQKASELNGEYKWRYLFQSILGREPSSQDLSLINSIAMKHKSKAQQTVLWALLNMREFIYIQ